MKDTEGREAIFAAVEKVTRHTFASQDLLRQALTHSSFSNERALDGTEARAQGNPDNERLEFLGDAVIGLVVAEKLMNLFPLAAEGKLSRWRSSLVSRKTLAEMAAQLGMGEWILLGRGERRTGGAEKRSILAAALEALVGAIYLDGGIDRASDFLGRVYQPAFDSIFTGDEASLKMVDRKTHLQERTQQLYRTTPEYRLVESWGAEHEKSFRVEIRIAGEVVATGDGKSKKEAEQQAASQALEQMGL